MGIQGISSRRHISNASRFGRASSGYRAAVLLPIGPIECDRDIDSAISAALLRVGGVRCDRPNDGECASRRAGADRRCREIDVLNCGVTGSHVHNYRTNGVGHVAAGIVQHLRRN